MSLFSLEWTEWNGVEWKKNKWILFQRLPIHFFHFHQSSLPNGKIDWEMKRNDGLCRPKGTVRSFLFFRKKRNGAVPLAAFAKSISPINQSIPHQFTKWNWFVELEWIDGGLNGAFLFLCFIVHSIIHQIFSFHSKIFRIIPFSIRKGQPQPQQTSFLHPAHSEELEWKEKKCCWWRAASSSSAVHSKLSIIDFINSINNLQVCSFQP